MQIVACDIGGTNARFALAQLEQGRVVRLDDPVVLHTADFAGMPEAWQAFAKVAGGSLPKAASLAIAGPITGGVVRFINSHWVIDPAIIGQQLGVTHLTLLNDFGAMAHAVDNLGPVDMVHLAGPNVALPECGAISVIGPGTGLGVAHIHFASLDEKERLVSDAVTTRYGRTSAERIVSGPGLGELARAFNPADRRGDAQLWADELATPGPLLDLFLASYGAVVGDLSLAHGAMGVALVGGLTNRLLPHLAASRFHRRFCDKGRYHERMESIPVKLVTHPQPGLFGAAAAFAKEHHA
jgi:glucokinase